MKTNGFLMMLGIVFLAGCTGNQSEEIQRLEKENAMLWTLAGPPPAILDSLYPPIAPAPVYQIKMLELARPFAGFVIKINEGDRPGARAMFDDFREQYAAIAELVPGWKDQYPVEPLDAIDGLIEEGDPGAIMGAFQAVGGICHDCHLTQMPKVQQKYHWPDFNILSLTDPITNQDLDIRMFMMSMELSLVGSELELKQGQIDKAITSFGNFKSYLEPLKESCIACHNSERTYFVDENAMNLVNMLEDEIKSESPNMQSIAQLSQLVGNEICFKCHLVHIPATYAKSNWAHMEK